MPIKSNVVEEALRLANEPAQPKQALQTPDAERVREIADALDRVMADRREVRPPFAAPPPLHDEAVPMRPATPLASATAPPPLHDEAVPMRPATPLASGTAPPPLHDEAVPMRPARQVRNARIPATTLVAVIIAVVMMWPITNIFRSYVERPSPTIPAFDPDRSQSSSEAPQAAQSAPAPLLTEAARTADGDGLNGPLALAPGDAPPPTTPTGPAEIAPNAPAVASGEAAAVTDSAQSVATSAQSVATAETASSEAVTPVQRNRLTATGPATVSIAPVGPVPLPRARPVDAPVDPHPVASSPPSVLELFSQPAPYGRPDLESPH